MGNKRKVFTWAEIYEHESSKDCWVLIGGKVYDVTKFLKDHPGGESILMSSTGRDSTDLFEDIGHSSAARILMENYDIGELESAAIQTKVEHTLPTQTHDNHDKSSEFIFKLIQFLLPLVILGVAVGIRFYTKSA